MPCYLGPVSSHAGIMSGRSKAPIKFSTDPDLSFTECYDLLDIYAPPHMKKNKACLKLFIRSDPFFSLQKLPTCMLDLVNVEHWPDTAGSQEKNKKGVVLRSWFF